MPTVAIRSCIALIALVLCTTALAQESFSTLEERMTGQEFMETGLDKLSKDELAALNEWIRARSLTQEEAIELNQQRSRQGSLSASEDTRGLKGRDAESDGPIKGQLVGSFSGWNGDTRFELDNGMVWKQSAAGTYRIPEMESPQVTIEPGIFGSWRLQVEGYNRTVQVERVK